MDPTKCKDAYQRTLVLTESMMRPNADPSYLLLHHNMMPTNLHHYIECTNIPVGMLKHIYWLEEK